MRQPPRSIAIRRLRFPALFLAAALCLVHALTPLFPPLRAEKTAKEKADAPNGSVEILRDFSLLPPEVDRMRRAILTAAMSGNIEAMRVPVEMNEIPPIVAREKVADPIGYWRKISGDGEGREILAILIQLFRTGFVKKRIATGEDLYIWPYFAELPMAKLSPAQEVELLTLISPQRLNLMRASGRYDHYRLGITQNGIWHFFHDQVY